MKSDVHKKHKKHKHHRASPLLSEDSPLSEEENETDSTSSHECIGNNTKRKQDKVKNSNSMRADERRHHHRKHRRHDQVVASGEKVHVKEEPHSSGSDDHVNRNNEHSSRRPRSRDELRNVNERYRNKNSAPGEKHKSEYSYNKRKSDSKNDRESGSSSKHRPDYRDRSQIRSNGGHSQEQRHVGRSRDRDHRNENHHQKNVKVKKEPLADGEGEYEWGRKTETNPARAAPVDKQKPNFGLSGKLTEDANTFNGVVIKYSEPPEARKPKRRWRFYPFKGDQVLPTLYIHRQSAYLIGRDRKVVDIPVDHPSCSKQHAALQYRLVPFTRPNGTVGKRCRPYIIDLESSNGTYVNNVKIEPRKYVELIERDVIKFGYSSRDYVLLHEHSKGDESDDEIAGDG